MSDNIPIPYIRFCCIAGYICSCAWSGNYPIAVSKKYVSKRPVPSRKLASKLMMQRLDSELAEFALLNRVNDKKQCCKGRCLKIVWRGKHDIIDEHDRSIRVVNLENYFGNKLLEVVIAARRKKYHTSSYKISVKRKARLQKDVGNDIFYTSFTTMGSSGSLLTFLME